MSFGKLCGSWVGLACLAGCGQNPAAGKGAGGTGAVAPVPLDEPSPVAHRVYDYSWAQALERVVGKLPGQTTSRAWHCAKLLLAREKGEEVQQALIRFLERSLRTTADDAPARNAIEVMRRAGDPVFSPVLYRASGHILRPLREEALKALRECADEATIDQLLGGFGKRDVRTQALLIRIVARRYPAPKAVAFLRDVLRGELTRDHLPELRLQVVEALEDRVSPAVVRGTLAGCLELLPAKLGAVAAKQLHRAGAEEGRRALLRFLAQAKDALGVAELIGALGEREPKRSQRLVLERAFDPAADPRILRAAALFLRHVDGEQAVGALEALAGHENIDVRRAAMIGLRGRSEPVSSRFLDQIETATGTELRAVLELAIAAEEAAAVPRIVRRLERAEGKDRRIFIQALGRSRQPAAVDTLIREIEREPVVLGRDIDSVSYAAIVITNIAEAEQSLWRLYDRLDRDVARRSHLLKTLANLAASGTEPADLERRQRIYRRFRAIVFDAAAPRHDRTQLLYYLKKDLGLDDCMALRKLLRRPPDREDQAFQRIVNDFLHEFF